jgi:hypothetical protein
MIMKYTIFSFPRLYQVGILGLQIYHTATLILKSISAYDLPMMHIRRIELNRTDKRDVAEASH